MYLLDTNIVSELRKLGTSRIAPPVAAWAARTDPRLLHVSVVTVLEVAVGVVRKERSDPPQGRVLREWLDDVLLGSFSDRTLPVDAAVALRAAALHAVATRPHLDALIAATALVYGLTVVTRNVSDFAPMGVPLLDPWT